MKRLFGSGRSLKNQKRNNDFDFINESQAYSSSTLPSMGQKDRRPLSLCQSDSKPYEDVNKSKNLASSKALSESEPDLRKKKSKKTNYKQKKKEKHLKRVPVQGDVSLINDRQKVYVFVA